MNSRLGVLDALRLRYGVVFAFLILLSGILVLYDVYQERYLQVFAGSVQNIGTWHGRAERALKDLERAARTPAEGGADAEAPDLAGEVRELQDALYGIFKVKIAAMKSLNKYEESKPQRKAVSYFVFIGSCLGIWISLTIPRLARMVNGIRESANTLVESTEEIRRISGAHAEHSAQQADAIQDLAATAEEIAVASRVIRMNADGVKEVVDSAMAACVSGRKTLETITGEMSAVEQKVAGIAGATQGLSAAADEIGSITEIIDEISDQTNLLALNAAIEAAGAGEAGKRFAVVATEVRRLSERTAEANGQIAALVESVRRTVDEAAAMSAEGQTAVGRGVRKVSEAGTELQTIFETVESSGEQAAEISASTEQQEEATVQMAQTFGQVHSLATRVTEGAQDASIATEQLRELAVRLHSLVGEAGPAQGGAPARGA